MDPVQLVWEDGTIFTVPPIWLRDNCPCSDCKVVATSERRKIIATEPLDLAPLSTTTDQRGVTVDWGNHTSVYSLDWYRAIQLDIARQADGPDPWASGFDIPRFSYRDLDGATVHGRNDVAALISAFVRYGIAIVDGVPTYPGECERFIARWAPIRELPFGRVHDVLVDPAGYNIAHTAEALPPHNDFASCEWPPSGQILHMLVNDAEGGNSIVVDGLHVIDSLTEEEISILVAVPVPFRQFNDGVETWTRAPILRRRPDGSVCHVRYSNQLMQSIDPTGPDVEDFYRAYHRLSDLVTRPENQVEFRLDAGDLLLLHGHRVLHGRTAYESATGRRHLQDVYFEFEDLVNHLFRLHRPVAS